MPIRTPPSRKSFKTFSPERKMSDEKEKKVVSKSFSRSLEGSRDFTGTLTYQQKGSYDEILADSPDLGVHSKHFPSDCVLQTVDANSSDGNLWTVVCKFFKRAVETSKFKHGGPSERNVKIRTLENQVSILNHSRYASIPKGFRAVFEQLSASGINSKIDFPQYEADGVKLLKEDYIPNLEAKTKITIENLFERVDAGCVSKNRALLLELYEMLAVKGIKTFTAIRWVVEETEIVKNYSFEKEVGNIAKPSWSKIPKLPNGGNWRITEETTEYKDALGAWARNRKFVSPEVYGGKWDERLYGG